MTRKKGKLAFSSSTQKLQNQLQAAGFDIGRYGADGRMGRDTRRALHEAEKAGYKYSNGKLIAPSNSRNNDKTPAQKPKLVKKNQSSSTSDYNTESWTPQSTPQAIVNGRAQAYNPNTKQWETTEECAEWANSSLRGSRDKRNRVQYTYDEVGGDAWTRLGAGANSKMIYSGYGDEPYDRDKFSEAASNARNWKAADNLKKNFNSNILDKNKVYIVNMYYNNSPNKRLAWAEATNGTTGTHTGNLYWNPDTNSWRVAHNIHGKIRDDDFKSIQGRGHSYGVTAIAEPKKETYNKTWDNVRDFFGFKNGGNILKCKYGAELDPITVTAISPGITDSKNGKKFIKDLNKVRPEIMQKYDLTDEEYADLSKFAVNIAQRESKLGDATQFNIKKVLPDWLISSGKRIARGHISPAPISINPHIAIMPGINWELAPESALSRGYTQIKYNEDIKNPKLKEMYDNLGITDEKLKTDSKTMAKATILRTLYGDQELYENNQGKPYRYSDGSIIPKNTARAIWWNRGQLTDGLNEPTSNLDAGGATGYARRFEHQSLLNNE